jgi:hypothetical protein
MAETPIRDEHRAQLTRTQHVLEWLRSERARLLGELDPVITMGEREQAKVVAFLGEHYGVDPTLGFTLDTERGVLVTPDVAAEPAAVEPAPDLPFIGRENEAEEAREAP